MTVNDIVNALGLTVFSGKEGLKNTVNGGYSSDLLSDVMGHAEQGNIWITLQTHKNVMAIASLKDLAAVIIVKGFKPDADTIEKSEKEGIPILGTKGSTFDTGGKVYNLLQMNSIQSMH